MTPAPFFRTYLHLPLLGLSQRCSQVVPKLCHSSPTIVSKLSGNGCPKVDSKLSQISLKFSYSCLKVVPKWFPICLQTFSKLSQICFKAVWKWLSQTPFRVVLKFFKVFLMPFQRCLEVVSLSESRFIIISKLSPSCLKV